MSYVLLLQCTLGACMYSERYELNNRTMFEFLNALSSAGYDNCNYLFKKDVQKEQAELQAKCAGIAKRLHEMSKADAKEQSVINALSAELAGHSNHLKAKTAKIEKHNAWYHGITQCYLLDTNADESQMIFACSVIFKQLLHNLDSVYTSIASEMLKIDATLLEHAGFIIAPAPEKPVTADELIEITKPAEAIPALEKAAKKQAKTPLVVKPVST